IEDDLLFECVVQDDPQRVQSVLQKRGHYGDDQERDQLFGMMLLDHDIEDLFGHRRKNDHHQRTENCAAQHARGKERVSLQVGKDAPDRLHRFATRSFIAAWQMVTESAHYVTYTRSLRRLPDLCRSLKVSSAIPDLSSSSSPCAIIRSYCSLVARAS